MPVGEVELDGKFSYKGLSADEGEVPCPPKIVKTVTCSSLPAGPNVKNVFFLYTHS